ncbi:MAG: hypothetical protein IPH45_15430 [Bacteroidales bacterium]|nr:hypothetical protein [Bacteroidales bacterium]
MAKKENTIISFEKFLKTYPGSHYEKEANARLEYAAFQTFEKGSIDDCNYYMTKFQSGYYLSEAQSRKEELVEENTYKIAVTKGSIPECNHYLAKYKNGKYVREVETRKNVIYAEMKEDSIYNQSKNGGIEDCNYYLANYPSGKYVQTVEAKKEKLTKEVEEELNSYNKLLNSTSVADMQRHLAAFPNGNHKAEVKKMIEPLLYKAAVEADWYTEYETYIKICPDGSNIEKVTQRLEFRKYSYCKDKSRLSL